MVAELVAGVRDDQWSAATDCSEWTVRDLVNHLVGGNLAFAALLSDQAPPERGGDHLGDDPVAAYQHAGDALAAAFAEPGMFDKVVTVPAGTIPGIAALHLRTTEALVHGWDLARATDQSRAGLPGDLAEAELAATRAQLADAPRSAAKPPKTSHTAIPSSSPT